MRVRRLLRLPSRPDLRPLRSLPLLMLCLLSAGCLDDSTLELGALDASALTAMTLSGQEDLAPTASPDPDSESMMDEENKMDASDATDDDVTRVTQAIRSEAAFDDNQEPSNLSSGSAGEGAATGDELSAATEVISDGIDPQASNDAGSAADIPVSFLRLQDEVGHKGALQVRLVEGVLSISTPGGARLHLPAQELRHGLKFVMSLGPDSLECAVYEDTVHIRSGSTALTLPLQSLAAQQSDHSVAAA